MGKFLGTILNWYVLVFISTGKYNLFEAHHRFSGSFVAAVVVVDS